MTDDDKPYRIELQDGSYNVLDTSDRVVCACGCQTNAQHYATLLNQAHRQGYKAGYRAGKQAAAK